MLLSWWKLDTIELHSVRGISGYVLITLQKDQVNLIHDFNSRKKTCDQILTPTSLRAHIWLKLIDYGNLSQFLSMLRDLYKKVVRPNTP